MAGIAYKEEIIVYGSETEITLNYTGDIQDTSELDWSQVFYQSYSVLLCKVYNSTLVLDQLFFAAPSNDQFTIQSIEENKRIRVRFPGKIVPQICICSDNKIFTLFVATTIGHIYKLSFDQDQGFTETSNLKDVGGYMLENLVPRCFTLVSISDEDYEVCLGLENGQLCFATLPLSLTSEYIFPSKTRLVEISTNFIQKVKAFVCNRPVQESVLRVVNLKDRQMLALSNFGVVRLYNSDRSSLLREIDLDVGLVNEFKLAFFVKNKEKFVVVGLPEGPIWWVLIIQVLPASIDLLGKFTEKGFLVDLGLDAQGVWSAWIDENKGKVVFKPYRSNESGGVFSFDDQILIENIEDEGLIKKKLEAKDLISRIFAPGRFTKKVLEEGLNSILNLSLAEVQELENASINDLLNILNFLKMKNWKNSQILSLALSEEVGHFPALVVRGEDRIGVLRRVNQFIEAPSFLIKKAAVDWNPLNRTSHAESLAYFRLACSIGRLNRCLLIVHTWRQSLGLRPGRNIRRQLAKIGKKPMSESLSHLLRRSLPLNLNELTSQAFELFKLYCTDHDKFSNRSTSRYISRFSLVLLGNSLVSSLQALEDYFIDLSLFLYLCESTLKLAHLNPLDSSLLGTSLNITELLWSVTNTLSSKFIQSTCKVNWSILEDFSYPFCIAPVYISARSDWFIAQNDLFCIENCNLWISNTLTLALQDLLTISEGFKCKNYALMNVLVENGQIASIENWYRELDSSDAPSWYFIAKAYLSEGKTNNAQKLLIRASTDLMSSDIEKNKEKLLNGPWELDSEDSGLPVNIFNLINSMICKNLEKEPKKVVILSDFIISTLYSDFSLQKIEKTVEDLANISALPEALTVLQCQNNRKLEKLMVCRLVEKAVDSRKFAEFLNIPLNNNIKDTVHCFLSRKAADEHFDLFRTILHEDYYDQASNLFLTQYPREHHSRITGLSWTLAYYSFCMRNLRFASAAEATYKITKEIENYLNIAQKLSTKEKEFLLEVAENYLVLTTLATRNMNENKDKCWFRVPETIQKTRKLSKQETMQLVTLSELESYFSRL